MPAAGALQVNATDVFQLSSVLRPADVSEGNSESRCADQIQTLFLTDLWHLRASLEAPYDANVGAPVRVRGEIVRTDLYPASWARPIASLGAALITTIIAAGHFGSAAPAKAQDGYGTLFGYDDHAAERLQQRYSRRSVRHSRALSSDHQANTAEKTSAPQEAVDAIGPLADQHVANIAVKARKSAPSAEATAPRDAAQPILAIVSIKSQRVTFYDADGWILSAPVSTGTKGRETPAGVFAVIEKDVVHHSTLYDDASMPHMQRLTWNGIALHGGPLPGYAASHGCVRMPYDFAKKLFDKTRIGMRVIISPDDATPVEFSHAALLVPNAEAVVAAPERAERLALEAAEAAKMANETKKSAAKAAREAASSKASLRKLEGLKSATDANLAYARKGRRRRKDRPRQGACRGTEAQGRCQGQRSGHETRHRQSRCDVEDCCRSQSSGWRQGGRDQED